MSKCCGNSSNDSPVQGPLGHFARMLDNCYDYAMAARSAGRPVVGILCEYTPRELILAAGGVPVCLCGGSLATIGPAERDLPAGLCPLIKSTYGYDVTGQNPFLEMADLIVAETTCDGKKKMYELMARRRPMYVLELPQKGGSPEGLALWTAEVGKFGRELERRFARPISDDDIRAAIGLMNRERAARRKLAGLMARDNPPLTGRQLLSLKSSISGIEADLAMYERAYEELSGVDVGHAGSFAERKVLRAQCLPPVRVLLTGVPVVHGAEKVVDIIESTGGLVVAMENCTGLKPILEDVAADGDPIAALAEKYFHLPCSVMTPNTARLELLDRLAAEYRPQCVVELIWQGCLTYAVESALVRRHVEERLKLPYLRIETDYSPSDASRIALRVEALFETL